MKKVGICHPVKRDRCVAVHAVLDSGATGSIVGAQVANLIGAAVVRAGWEIEGKPRDVFMARVRLDAEGCKERRGIIVADDELAARAGRGIGMILGQREMQAARVTLKFGPSPGEDAALCARGPSHRQRMKVRKSPRRRR